MSTAITPIAAVTALSGVDPTATVQQPTLPSAERFSQAYQAAAARDAASEQGSGFTKLIDPLLSLNGHSAALAEAADAAGAGEMRPGKLLELTMRSHEFLFHCELVSNVANRSSDGLQQLFRQQS